MKSTQYASQTDSILIFSCQDLTIQWLKFGIGEQYQAIFQLEFLLVTLRASPTCAVKVTVFMWQATVRTSFWKCGIFERWYLMKDFKWLDHQSKIINLTTDTELHTEWQIDNRSIQTTKVFLRLKAMMCTKLLSDANSHHLRQQVNDMFILAVLMARFQFMILLLVIRPEFWENQFYGKVSMMGGADMDTKRGAQLET